MKYGQPPALGSHLSPSYPRCYQQSQQSALSLDIHQFIQKIIYYKQQSWAALVPGCPTLAGLILDNYIWHGPGAPWARSTRGSVKTENCVSAALTFTVSKSVVLETGCWLLAPWRGKYQICCLIIHCICILDWRPDESSPVWSHPPAVVSL